MGEDTGVVFVLIPGGTFIMGAQSHDENAPNFDRGARPDEGPVHRVPLLAFFLARHELSQGQWSRLSNGQDPSLIKVGGPNYLGGRATRRPRPPRRRSRCTRRWRRRRKHLRSHVTSVGPIGGNPTARSLSLRSRSR